MTPKVVVLQHVAMEGPAGVEGAAARAELDLQSVKLFEGASVERTRSTMEGQRAFGRKIW